MNALVAVLYYDSRKAVVAFLTALVTSLAIAGGDGSLTKEEIIACLASAVLSSGLVHTVKNTRIDTGPDGEGEV